MQATGTWRSLPANENRGEVTKFKLIAGFACRGTMLSRYRAIIPDGAVDAIAAIDFGSGTAFAPLAEIAPISMRVPSPKSIKSVARGNQCSTSMSSLHE